MGVTSVRLLDSSLSYVKSNLGIDLLNKKETIEGLRLWGMEENAFADLWVC